tara:strand:- start:1040 stop:1189 length:150 start_codon:yes stop_codon:yes gene_type:complete
MFIFTVTDVIATVLVLAFSAAGIVAWLYQKYWFLPRYNLNYRTGKWERK